jgi:hypothetical protein
VARDVHLVYVDGAVPVKWHAAADPRQATDFRLQVIDNDDRP